MRWRRRPPAAVSPSSSQSCKKVCLSSQYILEIHKTGLYALKSQNIVIKVYSFILATINLLPKLTCLFKKKNLLELYIRYIFTDNLLFTMAHFLYLGKLGLKGVCFKSESLQL